MLARQKNGASVLQNNYPTALLPRQKNNDSVLQKNHQEQIVTYCEDSEVRSATLFNLSDSYYKYGDMDKALQYAYKLPNLYKTRENALVSILTDKKEKRKVAEEALKPLLWALELHMTTIAEIDGNLEYPDKLRMIKECMIKDEKENG